MNSLSSLKPPSSVAVSFTLVNILLQLKCAQTECGNPEDAFTIDNGVNVTCTNGVCAVTCQEFSIDDSVWP